MAKFRSRDRTSARSTVHTSFRKLAQKTRRENRLYGAAAVLVLCSLTALISVYSASLRQSQSSSSSKISRFLANDTDVDDGQEHCDDMVTQWEKNNGGIVLYICAIVYLFVAMAIICDEYFVEALEQISDALNLSPDVAGATFMAAGSSGPELFVSLADNVIAEPKSLGVGTIIGSAIFNVLVIIGITALMAGKVLTIDWRPLMRDCMWYIVSISLLVFVLKTGTKSCEDKECYVEWWEGLILFSVYFLFCIYMAFSETLQALLCSSHKSQPMTDEDAQSEADTTQPMTGNRSTRQSEAESSRTIEMSAVIKDPISRAAIVTDDDSDTTDTHPSFPLDEGPTEPALLPPLMTAPETLESGTSLPVVADKADEDEDDDTLAGFWDVLQPPKSCNTFSEAGAMAWFVFVFPVMAMFKFTIPDVRYKPYDGNMKWVTLSFLICIAWIGALSYAVLECAIRFGCLCHLKPSITGLTVVAAGTSVPDAISSIVVAKQGHANMAVANAIGSNVFDILVGLGLPFLISALRWGEPVPIDTDGLGISIIFLFAVVVAVVALLMCTRWRLHPLVGGALLTLYVGFIAWHIVEEA